MITYVNDNKWREIQAYLPEHNQVDTSNAPIEEWLEHDRFNIHIDHYVNDRPKATVMILHGVGGNGRLLSFIAIPLWKLGYEVICPDLPLYGHTVCKGKVSYSDWITCSEFVGKYYQKESTPFFVFGLSAGGMLAYQIACRLDKVDGILATCLLDQRIARVTKETASSKLIVILGKPLLKLFHGIFGNMKLPMKAVCNMKAIVNSEELAELLMSDPLSSGAKVSLEFLYGMLFPDIEIEAEKFEKCPVLLAHPGEDNWTSPELSKLFFDSIPSKKVFKFLEGAGHFPIETEGLNKLEVYCDEFMKNCIKEN